MKIKLFKSIIYSQIFMKIVLLLTFIFLTYSTFDDNLAKNLFFLNVATYCRPSSVINWTCKPCQNSQIQLTNIKTFYNSTGDILAVLGVSHNPSSLILVFRGTNPRGWKNWVEDFTFQKIHYPHCSNNCSVHRGFYHAYLEIQKQLVQNIKKLIEQVGEKPLIILGHSLGGALATHAAIKLKLQNIQATFLYTYGSPRVGDIKFSQWFENFAKFEKYRVTHGRDPVPHLPPHSFGFNHVTHQIFQKGNIKDGYIFCNDTGQKQDPTCSDKFIFDTNVEDHGNYCGVNFLYIFDSCL